MPSVEDRRARQSPSVSELRPLLAIADEDRRSARWLRAALEGARYRCAEFQNLARSASRVEWTAVSAVVLGLATPEHDGLEAIRAIRSLSDVPILVVTGQAQEADKIRALDAGADDYLTQPLGTGEFLARVRVALRHGSARRGTHGGQLRVGNLQINLMSRIVTLNGARLSLTPTDYKLLALLARNAGRVVPHQRLLHEGWGPNARDPHYLRVYLARLRRKLDPERAGVRYIVTEAGIGYRLLAQPKR